jgi:anti-sigma B factor antagonist
MTQAEPQRAAHTTNVAGLEVEQIGAVTVARIGRPTLVDEKTVNGIAGYLLDLVLTWDCRRLVLSLAAVKRLTSAMLGKIISLHIKLQKMDGRLHLCNITPSVADVIRTMHLHQLFYMYPTEEEAVRSLQGGGNE